MPVRLHQQIAEKLHALLRSYGDYASNRVKNLADLLIFIDGGVQPTAKLIAAVADVFPGRGSGDVAADLPPPWDWSAPYAELPQS